MFNDFLNSQDVHAADLKALLDEVEASEPALDLEAFAKWLKGQQA